MPKGLETCWAWLSIIISCSYGRKKSLGRLESSYPGSVMGVGIFRKKSMLLRSRSE
jgi:hypothetical protein